jgi:hypothetical protein
MVPLVSGSSPIHNNKRIIGVRRLRESRDEFR